MFLLTLALFAIRVNTEIYTIPNNGPLVLGQIFDACRISATRISAPKRLAVVVNSKILFITY
jgi:hypothetical protein